MKYDEIDKSCFNKIRTKFIPFVITEISHYYISSFSLFFSTFFKDEVEFKVQNKEKFLIFLNTEVIKDENQS
jgi:hypothetical protein